MSDRETLLGFLSDPAEGGTIEAPAVFAERYAVVSLVGTGGMGAVYRVRDEKLDEVVALKLLRGAGPRIAARLRSEVVMARKVTHPNVVRTFDLGEDGDQLFLTMEYVAGESLGARLRDGPMPEAEVLRMGRQLASAVAAAHEAGVLHRDLKPDNVLLAEGGRAVLTDFGIAQALAGGAGLWAGTPAWMAPEQRDGGAATPRSEVWALGAILYEALTGKLASAGVHPAELPTGLAQVVLRCLEPMAERRYASVADLGAALAEVAAASQLPAPPRRVSAPSERLLHVVPMRMVGPPDAAYLAEGLTEEIVEALGAADGLSVMSGAEVDPRAEAVVEGSLRWTGAGPLRLSAGLRATDQDLRIWSKKATCGPEELLALGELLARDIAEALTLRRPSRALSEMSSDASAAYFRARAQLRTGWDGDLRPTADLLLRALQGRPNEPAILSLLAVVRSRQAFFARPEEEQGLYELALHAATRAIRADEARGEPWLALAQTLMYRSRTVEGAAALRRAVIRAPGSPDVHRMLGYLLLEGGRVDAAIDHLDVAVNAQSMIAAQMVLSRAHAYRGDWERATELTFQRAAEHPIDAAYLAGRWWLWGYEAVHERALEAVEASLPKLAQIHQPNLSEMTGAIHALKALLLGQPISRGRVERALLAIRASSGQRLLAARSQFVGEFAIAAGHPDLALEAVELGVGAGLEDIQWLEHCPALAPLRSEPRFAAATDLVRVRSQAILAAIDGDSATESALDALVH